ncbi:MAG TPA: alpha/beta hydrolase [Caulobacteraceae bacterium]|nr:alpha/beta hydrolase [Caulobacteraceae bacterium]
MKTGRHRLLTTAALAAGLCYLLLLAAAVVLQRPLMYFPDPRPTPPEVSGPPIQVVGLTTSDGERLVGWYLPPQGDRPVILHFNGNGGGLAIQRGRWRRIADAGVGFLAIGYRGYAGSTGHPTEAGLHEDARTAYRWLAARYPPERIVVHGYSLGSGVAVRLAAEKPVRAVVLETPFTSAADVAAWRAPLLPMRLLMRDRFESSRWIGQVKAPILIVHGDRDSVIPFAMGEKLYQLAPEPKQFVRMRGSDHNTLTRDGLYGHVWNFLGVPEKS